MGKIFSQMKVIAKRMACDDPTCEHVPFVNSPAYKKTAHFVRAKVDAFLDTLKPR